MRQSVIIVDGFYSNPLAVREIGLERANTPWPISSEHRYFSPGIRKRFESIVGREVTKWDDSGESANGIFNLSYSRQNPPMATLDIHHDVGAQEYVALVYLTPDAPVDAGTSFWRHRRTGLTSMPSPGFAMCRGCSVKSLSEALEHDKNDRDKWECTSSVGNVFNRALIFRAGLLHSATRTFGSSRSNGRLTQLFNFSTL